MKFSIDWHIEFEADPLVKAKALETIAAHGLTDSDGNRLDMDAEVGAASEAYTALFAVFMPVHNEAWQKLQAMFPDSGVISHPEFRVE